MAMKAALIEEVREIGLHSKAWTKYCDERLGGMRDPNRHDAGQLQTFLTLYHQGSLEPPPEPPAPVASAGQWWPSNTDPPKRATQTPMGMLLVERIKTLQRTDDKAKQAWWKYCDMHLSGKKDPGLHDENVLQNFITTYNMGKLNGEPDLTVSESGADSQPELVQKVKYLQRSDASAKQAWWEYCDAHLNGKRDPSMHEAWQLKDFLQNFRGGTPNAEATGSSKSGTPQEELVQRVKALQRSDESAKQAWQRFCGGIRDPSRHPAAFLEKFLQSMDPANQQQVPTPPPPPAPVPTPPPPSAVLARALRDEPPPLRQLPPPPLPPEEVVPPLREELEERLPPSEPERRHIPPEVLAEMQQRCENFLRLGMELAPIFGEAWDTYRSANRDGLNDPARYQALVRDFIEYSGRCVLQDLQIRGVAAAGAGPPEDGAGPEVRGGSVAAVAAAAAAVEARLEAEARAAREARFADEARREVEARVAAAEYEAKASRKREAGWTAPGEPLGVRPRYNSSYEFGPTGCGGCGVGPNTGGGQPSVVRPRFTSNFGTDRGSSGGCGMGRHSVGDCGWGSPGGGGGYGPGPIGGRHMGVHRGGAYGAGPKGGCAGFPRPVGSPSQPAFGSIPKSVAIKKSITDQVRRLNDKGFLAEEIKLGRVAGSLAMLDEHSALQVLRTLESMSWVEDPNEFIIAQVSMALEANWS